MGRFSLSGGKKEGGVGGGGTPTITDEKIRCEEGEMLLLEAVFSDTDFHLCGAKVSFRRGAGQPRPTEATFLLFLLPPSLCRGMKVNEWARVSACV